MSEIGSAEFDRHAIDILVLDDLGAANDIERANKIHHGNSDNIPGYTWHHLEDGRTLILIPTDLHQAYRHTGGDSYLNHGLKHYLATGEWLDDTNS